MAIFGSTMRLCYCAVFGALIIGPTAVHACPPPAPMSAPQQSPGEADQAYYDRLVAMSYPNSWNYIVTPPRRADETAEAYAARLAAYESGYRAALERRNAARLVALQREEADRWEQAPQVLLVEATGAGVVKIKGQEWLETRFRVVRRVRGADRVRTFALRYPAHTTSCGPYYPSFARGTRLVVFAKPGLVRVESMLGYYSHDNARDSRTKDLLGPPKP